MARQTKMKIAALATTLVATLGAVAFVPASADSAGPQISRNAHDGQVCC